MRLPILFLLFFLAGGSTFAQKSTLIVSDTMFSKEKGFFIISEKEGWLFKAGNVADAAAVNLDTKDWRPFKPADLSVENLDKNGRFEGWFRIKVRFKNSKNFTSPGIVSYIWDASEVFANGKKIAAFGRTGLDLKTFEENKFSRQYPVSTNLLPDSTYIIAVHFVGYGSPFSIKPKLKSGENMEDILLLTNKSTIGYISDFWTSRTFYDGLLSAVSTTLSLLFWILFGLNRKETNIRRFAIGCTFLAILSISAACSSLKGFDYVSYNIINKLGAIAIVSYGFYIPFILAGVFNRIMTMPFKIMMAISCTIVVLAGTVGNGGWFLMFGTVPLAIAFYYLIVSWKALKGAQWAIVFGFLLSFIFLIVFVWVGLSKYRMLFVLIYTIAPPLGMLIYVSARFKEMISDVRANAAQVLQLSEEKRVQAINQQKVLEAEVEKQTAELRSTLTDLKATQSQLIQSEKMASLGELTAGIAHEIQNPLNFVNNFSDVSIELLEEMNAEIDKGDTEEVKAIASDIKSNLEKIAHHGKRADSIVKGMLQHSRASSGQQEPTDINALTDEYLRLAYHGLRAKDKSFNAELVTHFDTNLPKANVIPQDLGRVLLNLFTNAFYATQDRKKMEGETFKPTVTVQTSVSGNAAEIKVTDNGNGIPDSIKEKIFQPFFTTKPTGEGTGLGLSLAYDIIKAHHGKIDVQSDQGKGTEFTILLPI